MSHIALGASLYVPSTRTDLVAIGNGERYPELRSVIFCTEDSIRPDQLELALRSLEKTLPQLRPSGLMRFIRVRNPHVLGRLLSTEGIGAIDGFVLPKITRSNLSAYTQLLTDRDPYLIMPTLETAEVFDPQEMKSLRETLSCESVRSRVLALRIGGNDLLNQLGARRSCRRTIYDTPLGPLISMLAGVFLPHGFHLTAPVFEGLAHEDVLLEEVERDLEHGLFGKTAIHPSQIRLIESAYEADSRDYEMALQMLNEDAPAVFRMHDVMCEGATHLRWARSVVARAETYGVRRAESPLGARQADYMQLEGRP